MNTKKKKIAVTLLTLALTMGLTACNDGANNNEPSTNNASPTASLSPSASPTASAVESEQPAAELPESKVFSIEMEGNTEERVADLAVGEGYFLYIFVDQFSFDETAGKLTMNVDPNYSVEITKLSSGYNVDELKAVGTKELESLGAVEDYVTLNKGSSINNALVYLKARNDNGSKEFIVTEVDGNGYLLKVNIPVGEPTEGFVPLAHTSINSIANQ